ncbi:MAG TPA: LptF/LptG family permease [Lacunisphaera sp.]|nr:LptF/LptG family permease [Lacunisphaera sp.]
MNLFDRYLLREWLKMLGLLLGATLGLLLMISIYDELRDLIQLGVGFRDVVFYFATLMPSYLAVVLRISMLLSLLFVLSKLHRNNELTAMRTAGLNIFGTTRALWLAGVALCGLSLLLNAKVVPWSVETSRSLRDGFEFTAEARASGGVALGLVSSVAFDNQPQGRMWFMNRYSRVEQKAYGVTVSELDPQRREKTRIMAREGSWDPVARNWTFRDGREIWFDAESGEIMRSVAFQLKPIPHFNEDPTLMMLIDRKPQDLSFNDLRRITDHFSSEQNPKLARYEVQYFSLLADTLGPLIIIAIAIPFAVSGVRVSPAVGVSKSIGLFALYYVLIALRTMLSNSGTLEPLWAALMPVLVMIGLAAWFFGRLR